MEVKKTTNTKAATNQAKMAEKFLKRDKPIDYGRESKIANRLLKEHDFEFWESLELNFFLNSLAFFLTENGKKYIKEHAERFYRI